MAEDNDNQKKSRGDQPTIGPVQDSEFKEIEKKNRPTRTKLASGKNSVASSFLHFASVLCRPCASQDGHGFTLAQLHAWLREV